ncbi:MAG: hypothetical protein ACLT1K_03070, partial [[Clostridium] leptum]
RRGCSLSGRLLLSEGGAGCSAGKAASPREEEKRLIAYLSRCRLPVRRDKLLAALGYEADVDLPERNTGSRQGYLEKIDDAFRKIGDAMVKMVRLTEKRERNRRGLKLSPKRREVFPCCKRWEPPLVTEVCCSPSVARRCGGRL